MQKKLEKQCEILVKSIYQFIQWLDCEMQKSSSYERGKRIAEATSALEFNVDLFAHHKLGLGFRKISNMKKRKSK